VAIPTPFQAPALAALGVSGWALATLIDPNWIMLAHAKSGHEQEHPNTRTPHARRFWLKLAMAVHRNPPEMPFSRTGSRLECTLFFPFARPAAGAVGDRNATVAVGKLESTESKAQNQRHGIKGTESKARNQRHGIKGTESKAQNQKHGKRWDKLGSIPFRSLPGHMSAHEVRFRYLALIGWCLIHRTAKAR